VIGSGPEEARLRKRAGPGVTFLGRVPEDEKRERLGRAHALVATSVREGWGLVVTEAAASGTVAIGYDVPGLRDSIRASGGILTRANPASLATGLARLLSSVVAGHGPRVEPAGVVPWAEVAAAIFSVAREGRAPIMGPTDRMADGHGACRSATADHVPQAPDPSHPDVPQQSARRSRREEVLEG
jgi:glycosyltransferase involved in cell wall biosynthesis